MKNKYVAAAMAFLLGSFGAHKFYLREPGSGIFYVMLFMMTQEFFPVSAILGMIDGMRYLTMGQEEFDRKFNSGKRAQLPPPLGRRKKRRGNREYYEYPNKGRRAPAPRRRGTVLRSNPFKKSGLKKYKEFDIEEAIVDFEKGLKIQPNDESLHFHLACAYSLLENKEKAFHHISKAVESGFTDFKKIQNHDDLAYMRIQPEYEEFKNNSFREAKAGPKALKEERSAEADEFLLEKLGKLVEMRKRGIVTEADFRIEKRKNTKKSIEVNDMIAEILKDEIPSVLSEENIENALKVLRDEDTAEIVVAENGKYIFMLREIDLINSSKEKISEITSEREGHFAFEEEHFLKSIQKMHVNDLSILPVVDADMMYKGALRKDDLLDYLCDQYTISGNESIIIIEQAMRDYSLSTLSRIVEEEGGKIIGVFIGASNTTNEKTWVSLTIQTPSLHKTVSSLERHEYDIIAHMSGQEDETMIKERYESLMTFLNV